MPRRHYDLDVILAYYQSDPNISAADVVEYFGLTVTPRAIQKTVNKFLGPMPSRRPSVKPDKLRRRIVAEMVRLGLNAHVCCVCYHYSSRALYIRELHQDDEIGSLIFVCSGCKRAGDC